MDRTAADFVAAHTRPAVPPILPELRLWLADDPFDLWERTEEATGTVGLPPPFWGFAWAGGQALARYLLDHPDVVRGRRVLDVAAGCGVVAIAACRAGAADVTATEVDPFAAAAVERNAATNRVRVRALLADVLDGGADGAEVVLAGDVCYNRTMARRVLGFLRRAAAAGARVLIGDPGRAYLPRAGLRVLARYDVPVSRALEDRDVKPTTVWELA